MSTSKALQLEMLRGAIIDDVMIERQRQVAKWGPGRQCKDYTTWPRPAISSGNDAKNTCQSKFARNEGSYSDILVEEVAEAVDEARDGNRKKLRAELIQCAAVCMAWIESLDAEAEAEELLARRGS